MQNNRYRKYISIALLINGLSAIVSGLMLMKDPSGSILNFQIEWVASTPFKNYLLVGLIWLVFNGLSSFVLGLMSLMKNKFFADLSIIQGGMLAGWLTLSLVFIKQFVPILHIPYYIIALGLIVLGVKALNVDKV